MWWPAGIVTRVQAGMREAAASSWAWGMWLSGPPAMISVGSGIVFSRSQVSGSPWLTWFRQRRPEGWPGLPGHHRTAARRPGSTVPARLPGLVSDLGQWDPWVGEAGGVQRLAGTDEGLDGGGYVPEI